ncbi:MAG: ABC transporter transmembrane domain-containing protein, partial [Acidobacteriota bacterium]
LSAALGELGGLLGPQRRTRSLPAAPPSDSPQATVKACRWVAERQGFRLDRLPASAETALDVGEFCELNHVRSRRVALAGRWWRQDAGPLVGRLKDEGRTVALLPSGRGSYRLLDPESDVSVPVDAAQAERLEGHGWTLYRPLPTHPLNIWHLARAGWRGLGKDFAILGSASVATGVLALAVPVCTGLLVDRALLPGDRPLLLQMVLALVVAAVAAAILQLVHGLALLRLKSRLDGELQAALWDRLLSLPVGFFRRYSVGDMGSRAMGLERIRTLLTGDVTSAALSVIAAAASWALLFVYSPPMAWIATLFGLALLGVTVAVSVLQLRHHRQQQRIRGRLASFMYALLGGIEKLRIGQ